MLQKLLLRSSYSSMTTHTSGTFACSIGACTSLTNALARLQYTHITEERDLAPPDVEWLRSLAEVQPGDPEVQPDWFSALTASFG